MGQTFDHLLLGPSEDDKDSPNSPNGQQGVSNVHLLTNKPGETQIPPEDQNTPMQEPPSLGLHAPKQNQSETIPSSTGPNADNQCPAPSNSDLTRRTMDDMRSPNRKRNLNGSGDGGGGEGSPQPIVSSSHPLSYAAVTQSPLSNPSQSAPLVKKPKNNVSSGTGSQPPTSENGQDTPSSGPNSNLQVCKITYMYIGNGIIL